MKKALALFLVLTSTFTAAAQDADLQIGRLYRDAAIESIAIEAHDQARDFVNVGLEFAPEFSDLQLLLAYIHAVDGRIAAAIPSARSAVEAASWDAFSAVDGAAFLGQLHLRTRDYIEALLATRIETDPGTRDASRLRLYWTQLLALRNTGGWDEYSALLRRARDRFPREPRFAWLLSADEAIPGYELRRELERLSAIDPGDRAEVPDLEAPFEVPGLEEAAYLFARRPTATDTDRAWSVDLLAAAGWDDPRFSLLLIDTDVNAAIRHLTERASRIDRLVLDALLAAADRDGALIDWVTDFSGELVTNSNDDFYTDEIARVDSGRITSLERDYDQDGIPDVKVEFDSDRPVSALLDDRPEPVVLRFDQYPYVGLAERSVDGGIERFELRPRSMRFEAISMDADSALALPTATRLLQDVRQVTLAELVRAGVRSDLIGSDGRVTERRIYESADLVHVMRDENRDGEWDHLVTHNAGLATQGVRDIDADGFYEVAEGYRDGRLVAMAIDSNNDGRPEFYQELGSTPIREWDVNGDGQIDLREFSWWTGSVIRNFPAE